MQNLVRNMVGKNLAPKAPREKYWVTVENIHPCKWENAVHHGDGERGQVVGDGTGPQPPRDAPVVRESLRPAGVAR